MTGKALRYALLAAVYIGDQDTFTALMPQASMQDLVELRQFLLAGADAAQKFIDERV